VLLLLLLLLPLLFQASGTVSTSTTHIDARRPLSRLAFLPPFSTIKPHLRESIKHVHFHILLGGEELFDRNGAYCIRLDQLEPICTPALARNPAPFHTDLTVDTLSKGLHQLSVQWIVDGTVLLSNATSFMFEHPIARIKYFGLNGDICIAKLYDNSNAAVRIAAAETLQTCGLTEHGSYSLNERWELESKFHRGLLWSYLNDNPLAFKATIHFHAICSVLLLLCSLVVVYRYFDASPLPSTTSPIPPRVTDLSPQSFKTRWRGLDILRGTCTVLVFLTHCENSKRHGSGHGHIQLSS
jgi:hypothetical protein